MPAAPVVPYQATSGSNINVVLASFHGKCNKLWEYIFLYHNPYKVRSFSLFLFSTRWYPFLQEPPYGEENDEFFPLLTCSRHRRPGDTLPAFHYNRLPKSCGGNLDGAALAR